MSTSKTVQAGLCWTWSEIQIVGFLVRRLLFTNKETSTENGNGVGSSGFIRVFSMLSSSRHSQKLFSHACC